jgi:ribokinase
MHDLLTVGSLVKDVYLVSDAFQIVTSSSFIGGKAECVPLGAKIEVDDIYVTTGGGAGNVAATAASLGLQTACISRIGADAAGDELLQDLKGRNISTDFVNRAEGEMSGYSTLLTATSGERSVLTHRGASGNFEALTLPETCEARWLHITSLGGHLSIIEKLIELFPSTTISWNPGSSELKQGLSTLSPLFPSIDVLNLNKEEAEELLGHSNASIEKLGEELHAHIPTVLLTDGANGTYVFSESGAFKAVPRSIRPVSRTGAGDAFMGGFISGKLLNLDDASSLQLASLNAESVIQAFGAKAGILSSAPSKEELGQIRIIHLPL